MEAINNNYHSQCFNCSVGFFSSSNDPNEKIIQPDQISFREELFLSVFIRIIRSSMKTISILSYNSDRHYLSLRSSFPDIFQQYSQIPTFCSFVKKIWRGKASMQRVARFSVKIMLSGNDQKIML